MRLKIRVSLFFFEKNGTHVTPLVTTVGNTLFNLEKQANGEICSIVIHRCISCVSIYPQVVVQLRTQYNLTFLRKAATDHICVYVYTEPG